MFEEIVVAVDGSENSDKALVPACDIALKYGARLYLVHAPQPASDPAAPSGRAVLDKARSRAEALGCTPADAILGDDEPADEILRAAATVGADLIVMGRRGLGGVAGLFLGSVSQKVSQRANCSVMTVHT